MKTRFPQTARPQPTFAGLSGEQRVLLEQVSLSSHVFEAIRKRATALLLLNQGAPIDQVHATVSMDTRTVRSLIQRHRQGGVCAALFGVKYSPKRRQWLALSAMHH